MSSEHESADTWFTIFTALCSVLVTVGFILVGSTVARLTFNPHSAHHEPPAAGG